MVYSSHGLTAMNTLRYLQGMQMCKVTDWRPVAVDF